MSSTEKSGVYEYKFVYNNDGAWGGSDGNVAFQIQQSRNNWYNSLKNAEITLGGDAVSATSSFSGNNLTVSGLEAGKEYVILLAAGSSGFTVGAYESGQASY